MEYTRKVQYYETDQMGIVHHSNYIRWFEEARSYLLEQIGCGYREMEETGIISPVLSVNAEYKSMTHFYDEVTIYTQIVSYNGVKIVLKYEVVDTKDKTIRCVGESSHCFLDREGRIISLKKDYREIHELLQKAMENSCNA